jgi:hypothetical protein
MWRFHQHNWIPFCEFVWCEVNEMENN